ncbi:peptidoglycan-binding protein [Streptomyces sp. NPDC049915]|uniref:peptidoglycan-binding domain-containing protein n=1 Tax=Streptomyces sp. NPDC049915 TaxID=3155510 RepID=UPI00342C81A1
MAAAEDAAVPVSTVLPTPLAPSDMAPSVTDLRLFEAAEPGHVGDDDSRRGGRRAAVPRRRRRTAVLLAAGGAVVGVVAVAGLASGLLSYDTPSREGAAPEGVRAAVPDTVTTTAERSASPTPSPSAPVSSPAPGPTRTSASPSPTPSASASASASASTAARPSPTPTPVSTPTATISSGSSSFAPGDGEQVLRRGDRGPQVTELQLRLRQLHLYTGDANGNFNAQVEDALRNYQWARGVTDDGLGVYGARTRAMLESETETP